MSLGTPRSQRIALGIVFLGLSMPLIAADVLFPRPLHLTRSVDDPVTGQTRVIEEYCYGNRMVSVTGDRVVIADYSTRELTEIDRAAATYSITPFDDVARASARTAVASDFDERRWTMKTSTAAAAASRRNAEVFEAEPKERRGIKKMSVAIDRNVRLSADAAEVLSGAAYPATGGTESDFVLRASGSRAGGLRAVTDAAGGAADTYGLAVEQTIAYAFGNEEVVKRIRITRVGDELVPPDLASIPPGATRVESLATERERLLDELDRLPNSGQ